MALPEEMGGALSPREEGGGVKRDPAYCLSEVNAPGAMTERGRTGTG